MRMKALILTAAIGTLAATALLAQEPTTWPADPAGDVEVLTYDKRGSGRSTGDWSTASFADLAADLIAGIQWLRGRPDIIRSQVGVLT